MRRKNNYMEMKFKAASENEMFARTVAAAFCLQFDPSIEEINDIKTAVSEAVTNAVVHAYPNGDGEVELRVDAEKDHVTITVSDNGVGIKDLAKAREPFYTTKPNEERSGMGFTIMESFMDELKLSKNGDRGLQVVMTKRFHNSAHSSEIC